MKFRLLALAALVGCATTSGARLDWNTDVRVVVTNQHWLDQVVYADCGFRTRVGVAGGLRTTTLRLPPSCVDRMVSFIADPIGSTSVSVSDGLTAMAGDRLALTIPAVANGYIFLSR